MERTKERCDRRASDARSRFVKIRSIAVSISLAWSCATMPSGCASQASSTAESVAICVSPTTPLVLASSTDAARAESIEEILESVPLASRLDSTMGAPGSTLVIEDVTAIGVIDRQFTWNGRMFDSYASTRWTSRLQRR